MDTAAFRRAFLSRFDVRDRAALHELGACSPSYVTERPAKDRARRQGERPILADLRAVAADARALWAALVTIAEEGEEDALDASGGPLVGLAGTLAAEVARLAERIGAGGQGRPVATGTGAAMVGVLHDGGEAGAPGNYRTGDGAHGGRSLL